MRQEDIYHESFDEEEIDTEAMYNQQLAEHYGYPI